MRLHACFRRSWRRNPVFFDVEERLQRLSDIGDQLEAYAAVVDFELFRPDLEAALGYADGAKGGRPPYDPVLMFKILVIQAQNGLSDDKAEFLINDRLSFMRFLGLGLSDRVPDAKTIWMFRERLTRAGAIDRLFRRFDAAIRAAGYIAMSGQLVDSTLVAAPKQRNTRDEKQAAKAGKTAHEIWPDQPAKARQKDVDARWTIQTGKARPDPERKALLDIAIPTFGYKAHTSYRSTVSIDPLLGRHRRQPARRVAVAPGLARPHEHRRRRLGRHRVSLPAERNVPGATWVHQPHPPPTPSRPTAPGTHPPRQCHPFTRAGSGRARVRGAEAGDGTDDPDDRPGPGAHQDRDGQPRLQPPAPGPTSGLRYRLTSQPRDPYARTS